MAFEQGNGEPPISPLAAQAPGEHGISMVQCRFPRGLRVMGTSRQHMIFLTLRGRGEITCRIGDKTLEHVLADGILTVCPAGSEVSANGEGDCEGLILLVPKDTLAFATGERSQAGASPIERLRSEDPVLLWLGLRLARQVADDFLDGPLAWSEISAAVVDRLVDCHVSTPPTPERGRLDVAAARRVVDYIHANADRLVAVGELADAAGESRSHFPRLFRRTFGCSPYQYVIRVRLERAFGLLRSGEVSLAQVAFQTGFSDQSHMTRWMRRSHGATPAEVSARLG